MIAFGVLTFSLLLNIYSLFLHASTDFIASNSASTPATLSWLLSVLLYCLTLLILFKNHNKEDKKQNLLLIEKVFFFFIIIIALVLRLYKIKHLPLFLDEWYWLSNAKGILEGLIKTPFGFIGDQPSNMPAYPVALFLFFVKDSYLAVRLPGVLYSMFTIVFIFLFIKEALHKRIALLVSFLLAISIWDIHMSQLGWNNVNLTPFLISGFIFFIYRGYKYFSLKDIVLSGIFLGISINLLYIAALNIITAIAYSLYQLIINKFSKTVITLSLMLIVTMLLTISPTLIKIHKYKDLSIGRHKNFIKENIDYSNNAGSITNYYANQAKLALEDFKFSEEKYKILMLWGITIDPFIFGLLLIGILYGLFNVLKPPFIITFISFFIMFIPVIVFYRTISIWREYGFLPSIYILASIGLYFIYDVLNNLKRKSSIKLHNIFLLLITIIYFVTWYPIFKLYRENILLKEPRIYENYCRKTADYINQNIPRNSLVLLPKEYCEALISIILLDKYQYATYDSYEEIKFNLNNGSRRISIVKIADSDISSQFHKENSISLFKKKLKLINSKFDTHLVKDDDNNIYSVVFTLSENNYFQKK